MNRKSIFYFFIIICSAIIFSSCEDDDTLIADDGLPYQISATLADTTWEAHNPSHRYDGQTGFHIFNAWATDGSMISITLTNNNPGTYSLRESFDFNYASFNSGLFGGEYTVVNGSEFIIFENNNGIIKGNFNITFRSFRTGNTINLSSGFFKISLNEF